MSTDANALMAAPGGRPHLPHVRGLDGVRALAVLGIIAFHTGLSSVPGGFYGVDAFFVLSGFLITSLLVGEWSVTGSIRLRRFWAGRARRLLPALFLLVAVIGLVLLIAPRVLATPHIIGDALATVFYASNWYSIHAGASYFTATAQPSPLLHTWSLAIEEQFYLVWPLVVLSVLRLGAGRTRRRPPRPRQHTVRVLEGGHVTLLPVAAAEHDAEWTRRRRLHLLFALACFGSLASAFLMVLRAPNGYTTRAYYGTDTRAQALLVGAAIATGLTLWKSGSQELWFRRLAAGLGVAGLLGSALLWALTSETSVFAFSGGFLVASLAAGGVVLGAAAAPGSPSVRLLEVPPLPWLGRVSYGVYLWYWPVLLVMSGARLHWGVYPLFLGRTAVTVALASASYYLVEMPVRRGALQDWRAWVATPAAAAAAVGLVMVSTLVPVGAASLADPPTTTTTTVPGAATTSTLPSLPAALTPALPTAPRTRPVKVLLVGDSIAGSLGVGLAQYEDNDKVQLVNEGIPGCSLSMGPQIKVLDYTIAPGLPCDADNNPDALFAQWKKWVDAFNPDVVLYVARGETFDQEHDGSFESLGQPAFDRYVAERFRQAARVLGSRGATVVLMTSPYYESGTSPAGSLWPEDQPSRVSEDNRTIRAVATSTTTGPDRTPVYVFNLNQIVSPGGQFATNIGAVNLRCRDGVHFSRVGGIFVGLQLLPDVAELGQAHAIASPGGAWPGHLPPSTPAWFAQLPCQ
jgi:peptidoglycan/LPS O-acetylase OafA/YrhL